MALANRKPRRGRPPGPRAKYRTIAASLRASMVDGTWSPGMPLPALRSLAKAHRVSEYTVRLALKALRSEGYVATRPGSGWAAAHPESSCSPEHNLVVEVVNTAMNRFLSNANCQALQRGIEIGLGVLDVPLYIAHGLLVRDELPAYFRELPLRGVLLVGIKKPSVLQKYERLGVPVVLVDQPGEDFRLHAVGPDNERTAFEATTRLIALGHQRIAFVRLVQQTVGVDPDSRERERGFLRAMREANLPKSAARIVNHFDKDRPCGGTIAAMLGARPGVTAAVAVDPGTAEFLRMGAAIHGLTVPRDLSIVTWAAITSAISFTGWRIDFQALGWQATQLLREAPRPSRHVHMPSVWEEGGTIAAPPTS